MVSNPALKRRDPLRLAEPLLERLEHAKAHYRREHFGLAQDKFDELAREALPAAPDVWLEATFGRAECSRVADDLATASRLYGEVLARGCRLPSSDGRLALTSRVALMNSFLALAEIGRQSLRVPLDIIDELLDVGFSWTREQFGEEAAQPPFTCSRLLADQGARGFASAVVPYSRQLERLEQTSPAQRLADPMILKLLMANRLVDNVPPLPLPPPPDRDYFAFRWASQMRCLVAARSEIMRGCLEQAQKLLAAWPAQVEGDGLAVYNDLALIQLTLRLAVERKQPQEACLVAFRDRIREWVERGIRTVANLSLPLWLLVWLIEERYFSPATQHLQRGARRGPSPPPIAALDLAAEAQLLARIFREHAWISHNLQGRGVRADSLDRIIQWCERDAGARSRSKASRDDVLKQAFVHVARSVQP